MKAPTPLDSRRILAATIQPAVFALLLAHAHAGNTWDGGGGDDNWGTGANWSPDGAPTPGSGNDLFFAGGTRTNPFNNYTAFDDWRNITFNAGADSFNLMGNAIDLFGKIENLSGNTQTFGLAGIALNSATANEFNPVNGNLTITSANIFTNGNQLKVFGNNGFTLNFAAGTNIQQGGSLSINQNSNVVFNSAHTYTGDTFVNAGKLQFAAGGSANSSTIRIGDTSGAATNAEVTVTNVNLPNTFHARSGNGGTATIASLNTSGSSTLSGHIALDKALTITQAMTGTLNITQVKGGDNTTGIDIKGNTLTLTALSGGTNPTIGTINISGTIYNSAGSGNVTLSGGDGTVILSGANTYSGTTTVGGNVKLVLGNKAALGTSILNLGQSGISASTDLSGANAIANATVNFTGPAGFGGTNNIEFSGAVTQTGGSWLINNQVSGGAALILSGPVNLAGTLNFNGSGSTVISGNISNGGLGLNGPGLVTLSGAGANTYSGATNISGGELDLNKTGGMDAIGGNLSIVLTGTVKLLASNQIKDSSSVTMSAGAFQLNGQTETVTSFTNSGGTFTTGAGHLTGTGASITWSGGTNTINNGGLVEDGHLVITGGTNTVQGGATGGILQLNSSGAGLEMTGSTLTLNSDNSVAGKLLLKGNVTTSASATTANIGTGLALANQGTVDLDGGTRTFTVANGASATDLAISAVIANGGVTKAGPGTLQLSGSNTFSGTTTVSGGTLLAGADQTLATSSAPGSSYGLTLAGGNFDLDGRNLGATATQARLGTLTLSANSTLTLELGDLSQFLLFNDYQRTGGVLTIDNWAGSTSGGTDGRILFHTVSAGFDALELSNITFTGFGAGAALIPYDGNFRELVPVPEPSGVLVGLALCGLAGWRERRHSAARRRTARERSVPA